MQRQEFLRRQALSLPPMASMREKMCTFMAEEINYAEEENPEAE
jgi:hypothetical protein